MISEYWKLYDTLSSQNVIIYNEKYDQLNIKCHYGHHNHQKCKFDTKAIGCLSFPLGDTDKFIILKSPIARCTRHHITCYLYAYRQIEFKLYLGL